MKEKYQHLNEISKAIKAFNLRIIKEKKNQYNSFTIKYINEIELSDDVISDIIKLIQTEGNLTLKELIADVNKSITVKNSYKEENEKYKRVKNKKELIYYIKNNIDCTNYRMLNHPIDAILIWDCTKKGFDFYSKLNKKISKLLNNKV